MKASKIVPRVILLAFTGLLIARAPISAGDENHPDSLPPGFNEGTSCGGTAPAVTRCGIFAAASPHPIGPLDSLGETPWATGTDFTGKIRISVYSYPYLFPYYETLCTLAAGVGVCVGEMPSVLGLQPWFTGTYWLNARVLEGSGTWRALMMSPELEL